MGEQTITLNNIEIKESNQVKYLENILTRLFPLKMKLKMSLERWL